MSEDKSIRKTQEVIQRIAETIRKNALMECIVKGIAEDGKEEAEGITAQQIIDLIRDYLKQEGAERDASVFLTLLANFPKSMVAHNLTPQAKATIAATYWTEEVSMEDMARWFKRSKSTISEAIRQVSNTLSNTETEQEFKSEWREYRKKAEADKEKQASGEKF